MDKIRKIPLTLIISIIIFAVCSAFYVIAKNNLDSRQRRLDILTSQFGLFINERVTKQDFVQTIEGTVVSFVYTKTPANTYDLVLNLEREGATLELPVKNFSGINGVIPVRNCTGREFCLPFASFYFDVDAAEFSKNNGFTFILPEGILPGDEVHIIRRTTLDFSERTTSTENVIFIDRV